MFASYSAHAKWEKERSKLGAAESNSSPDTRRSSARTHHTRFAIGCEFCVTSDVQVVDTCENQPLKRALSKEQENWEMAAAGDPENAGKGWARAPMEEIFRRVCTAYTDAHSSIDDALEFVRCGITPAMDGSRDQDLASFGKLRAHPTIRGITRAIGRANSFAGIYASARAIS